MSSYKIVYGTNQKVTPIIRKSDRRISVRTQYITLLVLFCPYFFIRTIPVQSWPFPTQLRRMQPSSRNLQNKHNTFQLHYDRLAGRIGTGPARNRMKVENYSTIKIRLNYLTLTNCPSVMSDCTRNNGTLIKSVY